MSYLNVVNQPNREYFYFAELPDYTNQIPLDNSRTIGLTDQTVKDAMDRLQASVLQPSYKQPDYIQQYQTLQERPQKLHDFYNLSGTPHHASVGDTIRLGDPDLLSQRFASYRDWNIGNDVCKYRQIDGKYLFDTYGRQVDNPNTIKVDNCPGYDPEIAMTRDQNVNRIEFRDIDQYQINKPIGLMM